MLSGDIDLNDTKDAYGVVVKAADIAGSNTYQVLNSAGLSAAARLDGFVVTAGQANGSSPLQQWRRDVQQLQQPYPGEPDLQRQLCVGQRRGNVQR